MNTIIPISICIPCYNNPDGVKKLLNSILSQSFYMYECIITDDSDDDRTENVVKPFLADSRFRYVRNKIALGSPANWNLCTSLANGLYIKIMHHDDWFSMPDALQLLYNCAVQAPDCGFIVCGCSNCNMEGKIISTTMPSKKFLMRLAKDRTELFYANLLRTPSATFIRRDVFKEFDTNLIWLVDLEQYMRVLEVTLLKFLPISLVNITVSSSKQITYRCEYNIDINLQEYFYVANKIWGKNIPFRALFYILQVFYRIFVSKIYLFKVPIITYILIPICSCYWSTRSMFKIFIDHLRKI